MKDNRYELFPVVSRNGDFLGTISREHAHDGCKILHPVVHLHVFNSHGELYLQKRPTWKDIQPGKWDTAVGGHVNLGEDIVSSLRREAMEELGITEFTPVAMGCYIFESKKEKELVYVNRCIYDGPVKPSEKELSGGRFWSQTEILENIGKNVFTPNFEQEYLSEILPCLSTNIQ
ncbi:NTP pyrophosphohydrolase [Prevotella sp. oral taxon 376]|uniref:NUDIX hydrolase n=1 Tax=Prevotella sp. oral taxon 376 TaxID=712466 RepID=UPI000D1F4167|nr:NUDIX domain-containing protein [Prevotella sp. oral taxon 376]PTL32675.1 NTP pyrophosphohydrolase [Prevotella sp. oral taxon 376]